EFELVQDPLSEQEASFRMTFRPMNYGAVILPSFLKN
ncbi:uncharacterized protein METZ01_LOCUS280638, partial [marine metagenome]